MKTAPRHAADALPLNVLLIMDDQHHPDALSAIPHCPKGIDGRPLAATPRLDGLAAAGVRFTHAYTPTAICSPSRTCIATGMYPMGHGHYGNDVRVRLEPDTPSLIAAFHDHGYRTSLFGKQHLPRALSGELDDVATMDDYRTWRQAQGLRDEPLPGQPEDPVFQSWISAIPRAASREAWTADQAIAFIGRQAQQPFFTWLSFERPHPPLTPDAESAAAVDPANISTPWEDHDRFETNRLQPRPGIENDWKAGNGDHAAYRRAVARYYALIGLIDAQIGRVLDALDALDLRRRTLVIFCPDHGDFGGDFGQLGKNVPPYEQLYRVPLLWSDPAQPASHGHTVDGLWETVDILPSILARLGWPVPPRVQGESFLDALQDPDHPGKEHVFCETPMCKIIRTRSHKLTFQTLRPFEGQLFDMLPAPDELRNRWHDPTCRTTREQLLSQLLQYLAQQTQFRSVDPAWEPLVPTRLNRWLTEPGRNGMR